MLKNVGSYIDELNNVSLHWPKKATTKGNDNNRNVFQNGLRVCEALGVYEKTDQKETTVTVTRAESVGSTSRSSYTYVLAVSVYPQCIQTLVGPYPANVAIFYSVYCFFSLLSNALLCTCTYVYNIYILTSFIRVLLPWFGLVWEGRVQILKD